MRALEVRGVELEYGAKPRGSGQAMVAEPVADSPLAPLTRRRGRRSAPLSVRA